MNKNQLTICHLLQKMDEVVLLGFWTSPYVMRVKIALLEKGIQFQYKEERDVFENQNKSDLLLKSNPIHKKVPVLVHNGKPIIESLLILEYIDEVWKQEKQLFSDDPYYRAKARFWIDFFDKKVTILSHTWSSLFMNLMNCNSSYTCYINMCFN